MANSANNLTPNHQNILFFAKSENYKFNKIFTDYSETTNIDQILQKRSRDEHNKSIYAREEDGSIKHGQLKSGGMCESKQHRFCIPNRVRWR